MLTLDLHVGPGRNPLPVHLGGVLHGFVEGGVKNHAPQLLPILRPNGPDLPAHFMILPPPIGAPSGDRLRQWMDLDRDTFYDESRIAIIPMGLCYPGRDARGGDAPPRACSAPLWHPRLVPLLARVELILLIGGYAQSYYLGDRNGASLTETVRNWRDYLPDYLPLPHPSFRNNAWLKRNPWFDAEVLPYLRGRVGNLVKNAP